MKARVFKNNDKSSFLRYLSEKSTIYKDNKEFNYNDNLGGEPPKKRIKLDHPENKKNDNNH
jgi:hypothetical protein